MSNPTFVSTMKMPNVCLVQEVITKKDSADMDIPGCAYIFRQGGVKREITAIFTMEGRDQGVAGVKMTIFLVI